MMRSGSWAIVCFALLAGVAPAAYAQGAGAAVIYKSKCAGCHAADGSANTKAGRNTGAYDFRSANPEQANDSDLFDIVSKGKKKMPKFGEKLSKQEIRDLVTYIRGFYTKS